MTIYTYFKKGCRGDRRMVNRERQLNDQKDSWVFEISDQTKAERHSRNPSTNNYRDVSNSRTSLERYQGDVLRDKRKWADTDVLFL